MRLVMFCSAIAVLRAQDPLASDPSHYKLEIENQWVRVFREFMAPHEKMPMHSHPEPGSVVVLLTDRFNRLTAPDGTFQELRNRAGELVWSKPSSHRSENLTPNRFEALQIEPRVPKPRPSPAPAEPLDAALIDPQHYRVELDNEYVRVLRIELAPHEKLKLHKHPDTNAVLVHLTDQNMRLTMADGSTRESKHPAGEVRWAPRSTAHQDENMSGAPLRFLRIELKLSRE